MKLRIARDDLSAAATWIARNLPSRPAVPALGGILLDAGEDGLTMSGFDYETSTQQRVAAEISETGKVLVSGRLLAEITKALPNKPVELSHDGTRVHIQCGAGKFALPTMPVEDYPALPDMPASSGEINTDTFAEAVAQVAVAAGRDDTLPMLTGVRVEIDGADIMLVTTDRFRLAVRKLAWQPEDAAVDTQLLIPASTLAEVAKAATTPTTHISLADSLVGVTEGGKRTTTRLLDAEFPKWRQLLPPEHSTIATINVADLTAAIKRVALVAERGAQIILELGDSGLLLTAGGDDAGRAEEQLDANVSGDPLTICFNPGYLLDGLNATHTAQVTIGFTTPTRPAVLYPASSDDAVVSEAGKYAAPASDYMYLLMPVRPRA